MILAVVLSHSVCRLTVTNRVLGAFSEDARRRLKPYLEPVRLAVGKILYEPGDVVRHVVFPEHGVVSLLALTTDGAAADVAMIGRDGLVGVPIVLPSNTAPYQALVQIAGDGYRLRADILRMEFRRDTTVQDAVLGYLHRELEAMTQASVCNRYHTVRQRLCRWLLLAQDCAHIDTIALTQESLGHTLGTTRKRVSHAASQLQDAGCIRQRHGLIKVLDRRGLEERACECYSLARAHLADPEGDGPRILAVSGHTVRAR